MNISKEQLDALQRQDGGTLAAWWCELNCWRWPEGLPDPEPPPRPYHNDTVRWAIMCWIDSKVGRRSILRYHNSDMSDEVFEGFMRGERAPGTPYGDYSKHKVDERMTRRQQRDDEILASEIVLESILDEEFVGD